MRSCQKKASVKKLIPQDSHLARLVVLNSHQLTFHGVTSQTIAHIRTRFWIPNCINLNRKMIKNRVNCNRLNSKIAFLLMEVVPKPRLDPPLRVSEDVGLVIAGPFLFRKPPKWSENSYLALFVCLASKAVHLELLSDLSRAAWIAAVRIFVFHIGCPKDLYSDNGENFVRSE